MPPSRTQTQRGAGRITAVLGPTNTGKTHLAVERMLGHETGMIGCPLRLLAREIYDRVCAVRGSGSVALITGEEKIIPERPRYFVCTVESMPLDRAVEFLAIDEIQLAADPERGHIFTDRLLNARGLSETMFLGAETIRPLLKRLVPEAEFVTRPRFSSLSYMGPKKITRLPRRSAVIAFSASGVYALAETLRRQRGGTAVVLGALSPRTRNAQVAMYQSGEVDYLVATDAIGMGLNMDVDHVAFSALRKFDGRSPRDLTAQEIAQIAGRAGRHLRDGTFGTAGEVPPITPEVVEAVEEHRFDPLTHLYFRNGRPNFASLNALLRSLDSAPPVNFLVKVREATDVMSLRALAAVPEIARMATGYDSVRLLWDVCQVPDFSKTLFDSHTRLLARVFRYLASDAAYLPDDWVSRHVDRLDQTGGDIDALVTRIASVRTWNYIAHRPSWVADARGLQARTRAIEDKLSDALHDRLTQRFVDRRNAVLIRRLNGNEALIGAVTNGGEVVVEGEFVGRLRGFAFRPDEDVRSGEDKALRTAASRALRNEIASRVTTLTRSADDDFALADDGTVLWNDEPVARLVAGSDILSPAIEVLPSDFLDGLSRERVRRRLAAWSKQRVEALVPTLVKARDSDLGGPARGLIFQLVEALGSTPVESVAAQVTALDRDDRARLARLGVRFGTESVFMPAMLKPASIAARVLLWSVFAGRGPAEPPPPGRVSLSLDHGYSPELLEASGFRPLKRRAVRVDILERLAAAARRLSRDGAFAPPADLMALAGCPADDLEAMLVALGYRRLVDDGGNVRFARSRRRDKKDRPKRRTRRTSAPVSPFAELKQLGIGGS